MTEETTINNHTLETKSEKFEPQVYYKVDMQWFKIYLPQLTKESELQVPRTVFFSHQQSLGKRCLDLTTGSALGIQLEVLTRDRDNSEVFTRWIFFLKKLYTLFSKTYLFENHRLKSCHISLQAQSCFFVVFSIPPHHRPTDNW